MSPFELPIFWVSGMHDLWTNPTPFPRLFLPFPTYCMFSTVMGMKGPYKKDRWDWLKNYQSIRFVIICPTFSAHLHFPAREPTGACPLGALRSGTVQGPGRWQRQPFWAFISGSTGVAQDGTPVSGRTTDERYGSVSKPCTPGEHQNSW